VRAWYEVQYGVVAWVEYAIERGDSISDMILNRFCRAKRLEAETRGFGQRSLDHKPERMGTRGSPVHDHV
jgi:hypothetical protein